MSLHRFGIDSEPQTLEEFRDQWPRLVKLLSGFANSPDVVVGEESMRFRPQAWSDEEAIQEAAAAAAPCSLGRAVIDQQASTAYLTAGNINADGVNYPVGGPLDSVLVGVGDYIYAAITISATAEDGFLTGDWTASGGTLGTSSTPPTDHNFQGNSGTGTAYALLGRFISNGNGGLAFDSYGCGTVHFNFCANQDGSGTALFYRS